MFVPHPRDNGLGTSISTGQNAKREAFFETMQPRAYMNWVHWEEDMYTRPGTYYPTIWGHTFRRNPGWVETHPDLEEINGLAQKYPGHTWLLWNEPSLPNQAWTTPRWAIGHTESWIAAIKPHGKVACCGVAVLPDSQQEIWPQQGLPWMTEYVQLGGPIPDVWHIHVYMAVTPEDYERILNRWWAWWKVHGGGRPVIISETAGSCWPELSDAECLENHKIIMQHIKDTVLPDKRIIDVLWFASHHNNGYDGWRPWLVNDDGSPSDIGQLWLETKR